MKPMANILLTQRCNQQCEYCFASYESDGNDITLENFDKIIEFLTREPISKVGLLGGEPLLHKDFKEICERLSNNSKIKNVVVFTNGILLDKYIERLDSNKFAVLINCNECDFYSEANYERLKANIISAVQKLSINNVQIGLNIYKNNLNVGDMLNLMRELNMHTIRVSLAIPNDAKVVSHKEQFLQMKNELFRLFKLFADNDILPRFDCNKIPLCYYTDGDIKLLKDWFGDSLSKILISDVACSPVIDIYPDFTVHRCFGCSEYPCNLFDFKNVSDIKKYYINKIDKYRFDNYVTDICQDCYLNKTMNCMGGCQSYTGKNKQ